MTLQSGTRLGTFEVMGLLGAGGMGEVYRARDAKLGREVAIKVLPRQVAAEPERVARFEREARLLAALTHANIAAIYDLHEAEGVKFLVMELVEGATLADQLVRAPFEVATALDIFGQIAQALDYAHGQGIIHRDLKPANIKLDPQGQVKILDFGLAKAFLASPAESHAEAVTLPVPGERHDSTQEGRVLGTPAYMSPEQAQGKPVDKRTDIWGFGCCLYEALTGQRPFQGESAPELLAEILKGEPDWDALPATTPGRIRDLLWRCLQKDPRRRLRDIGDAWFEISDSAASPSGAFDPPPTVAPSGRSRAAIAGWIAAAAMAGLLGLMLLTRRAPEAAPANAAEPDPAVAAAASPQQPTPPPVSRHTLHLPANYPLASPLVITDALLALSRDGSMLVYVAEREGIRQLVLKHREAFDFKALPGTEGGTSPFFSPDGQWIGFYVPRERELKKVSTRKGTVVTLCDATLPTGATWCEDGTIIFASELTRGLRRVSGDGGPPIGVTKLDKTKNDVYHVAPTALPDPNHILFLSATGATINETRTELLNLETGERRQLLEGAGRTVYLPSGQIFFIEEGRAVVRDFDAETLQFTGSPTPIREDRLFANATIPLQYAVADTGTIAYLPVISGWFGDREVVWIDREGKETPSSIPRGPHVGVELSSKDQRVLVSQWDVQDLWIFDLAGDSAPQRFTFDNAPDTFGVWTPDDEEIYFASVRTGAWRLHRQRFDGRGGAPLVMPGNEIPMSPRAITPGSFDASGNLLLFSKGYGDAGAGADIGLIDLEDPSGTRMLLEEDFAEASPAFSPDGNWIAYTSDETGREEVFIRPYPEMDVKRQVSNAGGNVPRWNPLGGELFYRESHRLMSVSVDLTASPVIGRPRPLFSGSFPEFVTSSPFFDVSADGERFLVVRRPSSAPLEDEDEPLREINIIENRFGKSNHLAPTGI